MSSLSVDTSYSQKITSGLFVHIKDFRQIYKEIIEYHMCILVEEAFNHILSSSMLRSSEFTVSLKGLLWYNRLKLDIF